MNPAFKPGDLVTPLHACTTYGIPLYDSPEIDNPVRNEYANEIDSLPDKALATIVASLKYGPRNDASILVIYNQRLLWTRSRWLKRVEET